MKTYISDTPLNSASITPKKDFVILGGGQAAMDVTTTSARQGKFEARFYHKIFEEEIGRVRGHFGPLSEFYLIHSYSIDQYSNLYSQTPLQSTHKARATQAEEKMAMFEFTSSIRDTLTLHMRLRDKPGRSNNSKKFGDGLESRLHLQAFRVSRKGL
jgi:hypothetical protein